MIYIYREGDRQTDRQTETVRNRDTDTDTDTERDRCKEMHTVCKTYIVCYYCRRPFRRKQTGREEEEEDFSTGLVSGAARSLL